MNSNLETFVCRTWRRWLCGSRSRHRSSSCCRQVHSHRPGGLGRSGWKSDVCYSHAGPTPGLSRSGSNVAWSGNAAPGGLQRKSGQTDTRENKRKTVTPVTSLFCEMIRYQNMCVLSIYQVRYLIIFAGVSEEVSEEVEAGTFPD